MAVTVTVSMRGGCICYMYIRGLQTLDEEGDESKTYHHACPRATAKVQFAVDVTQVVPHWTDGAVERDDIPVLILQLR